MNVAGPPTSPLYREFTDYVGLAIRLTVTFDETTGDLLGATVDRDAGCQWSKILIGLGPDGNADSTPRNINVTNLVGQRDFSAAELHARTLDKITDITDRQITAGR